MPPPPPPRPGNLGASSTSGFCVVIILFKSSLVAPTEALSPFKVSTPILSTASFVTTNSPGVNIAGTLSSLLLVVSLSLSNTGPPRLKPFISFSILFLSLSFSFISAKSSLELRKSPLRSRSNKLPVKKSIIPVAARVAATGFPPLLSKSVKLPVIASMVPPTPPKKPLFPVIFPDCSDCFCESVPIPNALNNDPPPKATTLRTPPAIICKTFGFLRALSKKSSCCFSSSGLREPSDPSPPIKVLSNLLNFCSRSS